MPNSSDSPKNQEHLALSFIHQHAIKTLANVAPQDSLLQVLRDRLHDTSVKEGCASGDCGACTVVLGEATPQGLNWRAVNSCIRPAHAAQGRVVMTAAQLVHAQGLHPVQQALVTQHGSQCGFCTPGIAMSMFALHQRVGPTPKPLDRETVIQALSGNLCRCTGYRPVVDAACLAPTLNHAGTEPVAAEYRSWMDRLEEEDAQLQAVWCQQAVAGPVYLRPRQLLDLLQARCQYPNAQLVAGATDLGLGIHEGRRVVQQWLDVTRVPEMQAISVQQGHLHIGAAVDLQRAFDALSAHHPAADRLRDRFAGWPVRQAGTLGGNIANGSPIGDSMPLLLALDAQLTLTGLVNGQIEQRALPLHDFYTGYRRNRMQAHEVLTDICIPLPQPHQHTWFEKLSKRLEDDISSVCLALSLHIEQGLIVQARLGLGGVAATPIRHHGAEQVLLGQAWNEASAQAAAQLLMQQTQPISDLRASAEYRKAMLGQLLLRCLDPLAAQGHSALGHVRSSWQDQEGA